MVHDINISEIFKEHLFYSEYQPLWNSQKNEIFAYEALIRTIPNVNPELLFNYARENDILYEADTASVINAIKEYPKSYISKYYLFINVFPSTIIHSKFTSFIEDLLLLYPGIKDRVVFEINESKCEEAYWKLEAFSDRLTYLRFKGFRIAFDDLPLNNYSLDNIIKFNPHFIKLDRDYSNGLSQSEKNKKAISFFIAYSYNKMNVILEGIETEKDLLAAKELGVPILQGYYISKPKRL